MKRSKQFSSALGEYREKKQKELAVLKDGRLTYMTQKPLPQTDTPDDRKAAQSLCLKDALIGAAIITAILLVLDLVNQISGMWLIYPAMFAVITVAFYFLNWKRYRACCKSNAAKEEAPHED